jgi:predicted nucleic acid-binding protein
MEKLILLDTDILIAATALANDLPLLTRNRRHFERVPGLRFHPLP